MCLEVLFSRSKHILTTFDKGGKHKKKIKKCFGMNPVLNANVRPGALLSVTVCAAQMG